MDESLTVEQVIQQVMYDVIMFALVWGYASFTRNAQTCEDLISTKEKVEWCRLDFFH